MSFQAEDDEGGKYEERKANHDAKIDKMERYFQSSPFCGKLKEDENLQPLEKDVGADVSVFTELWLIFHRALLCQLRNPMDVMLKTVQSIFTAIIVIVVFGKVTFS